MRILFDLLAGVVACGVTYYLAQPDAARDTRGTGAPPRSEMPASREQAAALPGVAVSDQAVVEGRAPGTGKGGGEGESVQYQFSMNVLRNEVIQVAFADMHRRGEDVMKCLGDRRFSGAEKLRFSVDIVSTPVEATTGRWQFLEVVDGEPLSDSFGPCAAHALGGGQHVVATQDLPFPAYSGELSFVYTIPAPPPGILEEPAADAASSR